MKKFKSLVALFLVGIFSFVIVGCGDKSPSDIVTECFNELKNNDNPQINAYVQAETLKEEKDLKYEELGEYQQEIINEMKNIDYKINSEKIDGDNATVNVTVKGVNVYKILGGILIKSMGQAMQGTELTDEQRDEMFRDEVKNTPKEERKVDIHLVKIDGVWKIKDDGSLSQAIMGVR